MPDTAIATMLPNLHSIGYPVAFGFAYEGSVGPQFANGAIDEAKIWGRGLSPSEVAFEAGAATAAELQLPAAPCLRMASPTTAAATARGPSAQPIFRQLSKTRCSWSS